MERRMQGRQTGGGERGGEFKKHVWASTVSVSTVTSVSEPERSTPHMTRGPTVEHARAAHSQGGSHDEPTVKLES